MDTSVTELGCKSGRPGRRTGFRKTGLVVRGKNGIQKTGLEKTGFGLQADRARPGKNWIISVCALQLQLQSYKRVYVCPKVADCVRPSRAPTSRTLIIKHTTCLENVHSRYIFYHITVSPS